MMNQIRNLCIALLASLLAAACATPEPAPTLPEMTFGHLPPLNLSVRSVGVVSEYAPPLQAPNVEHQFPTPPEKALRRWGTDRLKAGGKSNDARFTIINAAVKETPLKTDRGVSGTFKVEQSERYAAEIEALLEILDDRGRTIGHASTRVTRSRTIAEDASLYQREKMWFKLTEDLMKDFDMEMEKNIRRYLVNWLR